MALWLNFLWVLISVAVVIFTAHFAINSSVKIAKRFKLSDALIGMTILSIGTSIPEIITHIVGSVSILQHPSLLNEISGLVVGTNIGSDIFQQNFVLGLIGIIGVIVVHKKNLVKHVGGLILASMLLLLFSLNGLVSRLEGFILLGVYIAYLFWIYNQGKSHEELGLEIGKNNVWKNVFIILFSFVAMTFAANSMLKNSEIIVQNLSISASFFGVIFLGIASAFPELTTSLIAVFKKKAKISAGILIGSNITNPMFALGLGALISTYTIPSVVIWFDLPIKIATAFLIFFMLRKGHLSKKNAVVLMGLYVLYLILRNMYFPADIFLA